MSIYKKGDLVEVTDGSYTLTIEAGKLRQSNGIELEKREFEVFDVGLVLPSTQENQFNTMIIKAKDNEQVVFIQERMIRPMKTTPIKPTTINLSLSLMKTTPIKPTTINLSLSLTFFEVPTVDEVLKMLRKKLLNTEPFMNQLPL